MQQSILNLLFIGEKMSEMWDPAVAKDIKKLESERRIELLTKLIVDKAKAEVEDK